MSMWVIAIATPIALLWGAVLGGVLGVWIVKAAKWWRDR